MRVYSVASKSLRIELRRDLVPHLDQVAVPVTRKDVSFAGTELSVLDNRPSGLFDRVGNTRDTVRVGQSEPEMGDGTGSARLSPRALEYEDIARSGCLGLEKLGASIHRDHPEHLLVELEGTIDVGDAEGEVCQPECGDH